MEGSSQGRRRWSDEEEEALVELMEVACEKRLKCEGGNFKSGVIQDFERKLKKNFPNAGIKARPHIESAMKRFKTMCASYGDMVSQSGFGWDPDKHCIVVEDSVWNEYVKDRATGGLSQTPTEAEEDEVDQEVEQEAYTENNFNDHLDDISFTQAAPSAPIPASVENPRKRKIRNDTAVVIQDFGNRLVESMDRGNEYFRDFARAMAVEDRLYTDRRNVANELENMGLSAADLFKAQRLIVRSSDEVHIFWGIPSHLRKEYVLDLLSREQ